MRLLGWGDPPQTPPLGRRWAASSLVTNRRKNLTDFESTDGEMTPLLGAGLAHVGLGSTPASRDLSPIDPTRPSL